MTEISDFDKEHIERLLDEVLGGVSFHGDTYDDEISMRNIKLHEIALNHIWAKLKTTGSPITPQLKSVTRSRCERH